MEPFTVQQRFGLKPEELNALSVLSGLEGYRGPKSTDPAAVTASTLQRRLSGKWGGKDIRNIATAPGQFAAILDRGITMQQLGDPAFGAKILGGKSEFDRIQSMINNPEIVRSHMGKVGESFRSLSAGPKPGDYIPVPGLSNFYYGQNPTIVKRGTQLLEGPTKPTLPPGPTTTSSTPREQGNGLGANLLNLIKNTRLGTILGPQSNLPGYSDLLSDIPDPQSYLQAFRDRLLEEEEA
jgi:hypothetical protein